MGLEDFRKQAKERSYQLRLEATEALSGEIDKIITQAEVLGFTEFDADAKFYPEKFGVLKEVEASETRTVISLWDEEVVVSERLYDNPETGEAERLRFISADSLPRDRRKAGLSGPVGIMAYLDNEGRVSDVQAKCDHNNHITDAPTVVILDIAEALKRANDNDTVRFEQQD